MRQRFFHSRLSLLPSVCSANVVCGQRCTEYIHYCCEGSAGASARSSSISSPQGAGDRTDWPDIATHHSGYTKHGGYLFGCGFLSGKPIGLLDANCRQVHVNYVLRCPTWTGTIQCEAVPRFEDQSREIVTAAFLANCSLCCQTPRPNSPCNASVSASIEGDCLV